MKKSMINVITLALVLINLVLTVILTFSLVSTNNKTNKLISKVAQIINLDLSGETENTNSATTPSMDDIEFIDVMNNDSKNITISYTESGKTHYVVLNASIGINKKAKDYETRKTSINNGMKLIVSQLNTEALKYSYDQVSTNKTNIESSMLDYLQNQFKTDAIYSVTITNVLVQ